MVFFECRREAPGGKKGLEFKLCFSNAGAKRRRKKMGWGLNGILHAGAKRRRRFPVQSGVRGHPGRPFFDILEIK